METDSMTIEFKSVTASDNKPRRERRFHFRTALLIESVRLETFSAWTTPYVSPDQLAKGGFFFLRNQDHVQCIFCEGIVGYWEQGDQPDREHKKHFPNCQFVKGAVTGNVPLARVPDATNQAYKLLEEYHAYRVAFTKPMLTSQGYQQDSISAVEAGTLAFPHLNTVFARLSTFSRWPQDVSVRLESLAEAGFYSIGLSDWVQCFNCGGGLFNWQFGDDPSRDHARYYPHCPFIRTQIGDEAVGRYSRENYVPSIPPRSINLTESEAELLLAHPMAQRLVEMGLSRVSVREALRRRVEARGLLCRSIQEALEIVYDFDEHNRRKEIPATPVIIPPSIPPHTNQRDSTCTPTWQLTRIPASIQSSVTENIEHNSALEVSKLQKEVDFLKVEVAREEKRLMCWECGRAQVAVVFQPCSHLHLCVTCARPKDMCPSCGTLVRGTLKPIIG